MVSILQPYLSFLNEAMASQMIMFNLTSLMLVMVVTGDW